MLSSVLNSAWYIANLPSYLSLKYYFSNPRTCQQKILSHILRSNVKSVFGKHFRFSSIRNIRDYQNYVPVQQYDDIRHMVEDIRRGKANVLTSEPVTHLMPSSGTTSARKLIPHTRSLQKQFDRAIAAWIADTYSRHPGLVQGRAYWSITPYLEEEARQYSVPVGFQRDSSYLGGIKQRLVEPLMAVQEDIAQISDAEAFRYITLLELLRCGDLRLISVWHPSFMTLLMSDLHRCWETLLRDLHDGTISIPCVLSSTMRSRYTGKPNRKRCIQLSHINRIDGRAIWPDLEMISCWGGKHAKEATKELETYFPEINIQHKGLIATEAFMSLPFGKDESNDWLHPLAINSHFFEFIDDKGDAYLVDEILDGHEYEIAVTTGGGLYRYAMNDRIKVNGFIDRTPSIQFIGKGDSVSDYYGEKLNDQFVANLIDSLISGISANVSFSMLAPDGIRKPEQYTLYLEAEGLLEKGLCNHLDEKLCANPHYAQCRRLGQLEKARVFQIRQSANQAYLLSTINVGKRLGDIKPVKLSNKCGWSETFKGDYLAY